MPISSLLISINDGHTVCFGDQAKTVCLQILHAKDTLGCPFCVAAGRNFTVGAALCGRPLYRVNRAIFRTVEDACPYNMVLSSVREGLLPPPVPPITRASFGRIWNPPYGVIYNRSATDNPCRDRPPGRSAVPLATIPKNCKNPPTLLHIP